MDNYVTCHWLHLENVTFLYSANFIHRLCDSCFGQLCKMRNTEHTHTQKAHGTKPTFLLFKNSPENPINENNFPKTKKDLSWFAALKDIWR